MLWLALQFPRLGLEVWRDGAKSGAKSGAAETNDPPTILLDNNRVVLGNFSAAEAGVLPGCTLATAHSISSELQHFHREEAREQTRLKLLAETLYRFSAQVSLEPPDGLVLEIGGSLELFGDAASLTQQACTLCEELGHEVRWQLASTPLAALAMARAGVKRLEDVPISCAQIPTAAKNIERLANMGMHTLLPLLHLPATELGQRFGPDMVDFLDRLTGRAPDPKCFIELSPQFNQVLHLLEPIQDKDALLFPMQRLLSELSHWLVGRQLGAEQLVWSFSTHTEEERVVLPLRFARAQQSKGAFLNIVRLRLEQVVLPGDILNIRLEAARLSPWLGGSQNLFRLLPGQTSPDEVLSDSSELIDQLRARLGSRACSGITAHDQHAPESAWASIQPREQAAHRIAALPDPPRPLWLFDPPHLTSREHLTLLKGPERIQTAWWQRTIWRDYYVASLGNGAKCWAFVDTRNQWYLHGYFG